MAVYFSNTLIKSGDFIRTTRIYSSAQSLNRDKKKGTHGVVAIGKLHFVRVNLDEVRNLYGVQSWDGLLLMDEVPAGLSPLSKISKKIKMGEPVILGWALLNRLDVYWIDGHFFSHAHRVEEIAKAEPARVKALTIPPLVRKRRKVVRYH